MYYFDVWTGNCLYKLTWIILINIMSEIRSTYTPNEPATPAERYLQEICRKTFLSLWSYPGLYKSPGDELCDLLVIFGNDVIIFSDKYCKFPNTDNLEKDWERWFKRAVYKSAKQAWGAERWIKNFPGRIFTDNKATIKFPFELPSIADARFHLIVVAHDGSRRCKEVYGGNGSLMIATHVQGINEHTTPFYIGDLDKSKSYIHVLDDTTLNIIVNKLDTISDFVSYLAKKEQRLRSTPYILTTGEEELLAVYLKNINKEGLHDFIFPEGDENPTHISISEGFWESFLKSEAFKKQQEADKISYVWDRLIEKFSYYALTGTQYLVSEPGLQTSERILRLMARETRVRRRMLSKQLIDLLQKTPIDKQMCKISGPLKPGTQEATYVFVLVPQENMEEKVYREFRGGVLDAWCHVAKKRIPHAKAIVGIATQPGLDTSIKSEDAVYLDATEWSDELEDKAQEIFKMLNLKPNVEMNHYHEKEYPELVNNDPRALSLKLSKNPRNKLCPCGSGKKFKKCHGK